MLEEVVFKVGIENVEKIITNNETTYVTAKRFLKEKNQSLFWTPCTSHYIDLLVDIGKIDWVRSILDNARNITKFIYNHP